MTLDKAFAKKFTWACIFGFISSGIAAAWFDDERFGMTAFVLLVGVLIGTVAAVS